MAQGLLDAPLSRGMTLKRNETAEILGHSRLDSGFAQKRAPE